MKGVFGFADAFRERTRVPLKQPRHGSPKPSTLTRQEIRVKEQGWCWISIINEGIDEPVEERELGGSACRDAKVGEWFEDWAVEAESLEPGTNGQQLFTS